MGHTETDPPASEAGGSDQRRHPRARLSLLVQYRLDTFEDFMSEYSADISLGGMFIRTKDPRPVGSRIYLQFALKDGSSLIEGLGRVVHVNEAGGAGEAGMGIEFESFDDESRKFIEELVASRLAEGGGAA